MAARDTKDMGSFGGLDSSKLTAMPTREVVRWSRFARWGINTHAGRWTATPVPREGPVLLVGCGTTTALGFGRSFPQAEVTAVDPSAPRVVLTRNLLVRNGQRNVAVRLGGLDALAGGGPFALIAAQGVIERLEDPSDGLRRMLPLLAPGGVIRLRLPSHRQRDQVREFGEMLDLLTPSDSPVTRVEIGAGLTHGVDFTGSRMFDTINAARDLYRNYLQAWEDAYVTPSSHVFTVSTLLDLIESAGLRLLGWVRPDDWHVAPRLTDPLIGHLFEQLDERRRWEFVDRLRAPHFELYCGRASDPPALRPWMTDEELLLGCRIRTADTYEQMSHDGELEGEPQVRRPFKLTPTPGDPNAITLQTPGGFELTIHPFHAALVAHMDGKRTLRQVIERTADAYGLPFATACHKVVPLLRSLIDPHGVLVVRPSGP